MLTAVLCPPDHPAVEGLVLAADDGSLRVALPWEVAPDLPDGSVMDAILETDRAAFRTEVAVLGQQPEEDALEWTLAWSEPDRVRLRMPGLVSEALARATERLGHPVRASLVDGGGTLLDLTADGLTLLVDPTRAPRTGTVRVRLDLPDGGPTAEPRARVTSRWERGPELAVTLRFATDDAPTARLKDRIHAFLAGRASGRGVESGRG